MQHKSILLLAVFVILPLQAQEMERSTITTCAYQAGTAREIQTIRQTEGDDWTQFEQKINKIYKGGQGRTDLLAIAKNVYLQPITDLPQVAYDNIFSACVKRIKGVDLSV